MFRSLRKAVKPATTRRGPRKSASWMLLTVIFASDRSMATRATVWVAHAALDHRAHRS